MQLTFGERLLFRSEYWQYLESEKCQCGDRHHQQCHINMMSELMDIERGWLKPHLARKIIERMREFAKYTKHEVLKAYANHIISEIARLQARSKLRAESTAR